MRISEADNAAQYWPNLGSQQSAIAIGPVSPFASVKGFSRNLAHYRPHTKPILTFTMASSSESRKVRVRTMDQHISETFLGPLLCRKQVFVARIWAKIGCQVHTGVIIPEMARYWQPIFGKKFADARPVLDRILLCTWVVKGVEHSDGHVLWVIFVNLLLTK